jgi:hypothetical protein
MFIKKDNIIIRDTRIRTPHICEECKKQIDAHSAVILMQIPKTRKSFDRKYYHINCYKEENT